MRKYLLAAVIGLLCGTPAAAAVSGYDHFSLGMAAFNRQDTTTALSEFSSAIEATDLTPSLVPVARIMRARILLSQQKCIDALTDARAALSLKPDNLDGLLVRAAAERCVRDFSSAIADYQAYLAKRSNSDVIYEEMLCEWMNGDFNAAAALLESPDMVVASPIYRKLLAEVMRARAGNVDRNQLAADMSSIDLNKWPGPVFDLYLGKMQPDDVFAAASSGGNNDTINGQTCEANFYVAEWWLAQGQPKNAKAFLDSAVKDCPKGFFEYGWAQMENGGGKS